jgi:hypothetical protein
MMTGCCSTLAGRVQGWGRPVAVVNTTTTPSIQRTQQHRITCSVSQGDASEPAGAADTLQQGGQQDSQVAGVRGREYFAGLVSSDIRSTNNSTPGDMLARSLQLAGELQLVSAPPPPTHTRRHGCVM